MTPVSDSNRTPDAPGRVIARGLAVWFLLLVVAIGGAGVREGLLVPRLGELPAHILGTLLVVGAFLVLIRLLAGWIVPSRNPGRLLRLGAGWTLLTVVFEFGFGHWVMGHPWSRLLHDYNVFAGRVWVLVLLTLLLGPWLVGGIRWKGGER